jgi:uncharacterized protein (TIGR02270 family)
MVTPISFNPAETSAIVLKDIVDLHAEEAAFLWSQRSAAVIAPHFDLPSLARLDARVEAHLDGLRVAGPAGIETARQYNLPREVRGALFTLSVLTFEQTGAALISECMQTADAAPALLAELEAALDWSDHASLHRWILQLKASSPRHARWLAVRAWEKHGLELDQELLELRSQPTVALRASALRAAGARKRRYVLPEILEHLKDPDDGCREAAAVGGTLLGARQASELLWKVVCGTGRSAELALALCMRALPPAEARRRLNSLASGALHERLRILGTGFFGDPSAVPCLLELMSDARCARVAGEAFALITGADLEFEDLEQPPPEPLAGEPAEDDREDLDANLPWPNQNAVGAWWHSRRAQLQAGTRYLRGRAIGVDSCIETLRIGKQRQRAAAALELAFLAPDAPLFDVTLPAARQLVELQALTGLAVC